MARRHAAGLTAALVVALCLVTGGSASAATTLFVDIGNASCSDVGPGTAAIPFCSIQPAVDAAAPGTTISVNPGTYAEQVTVGPGKNGVKLIANGAATIAAPAVLAAPGAIVRVTGSDPVRVGGFTITGPSPQSCGALTAGVRVDGGGRVFVVHDHITAIRTNPIGGCQTGYGVRAGSTADGTTGRAVILHSVIDDYQKDGILADNTGSNVFVRYDTVVGSVTPATALNGIQIARGATGQIRDTTVSNNQYTGTVPDTSSSGILLFPFPGVSYMRDDTVTANDVDVWLYGAMGSKIVRVTATGATLQGFAVQGDPTFGISTANILKFLTATGNGGPDVQDDSVGGGTAGTANAWRFNTCGTSLPVGLCA
ncbi:MAG TPA: right-handed parallel beta-helix repeat-containing protein [Actinomycetota bacterium]|nr:right-handed parallel beta-helix repeat-containing protein [Actinomycetota bacterium]